MIHTDAPDHTRLRGLVNRAFTPQVVAAMEQDIQSVVDDLLDTIPDRGEMDLIESLAYPLPLTVIAGLLGLPPKDREQKARRRGMPEHVDQVVAHGGIAPDPMFEPECRMQKRIVLLRRADLEPDPNEP